MKLKILLLIAILSIGANSTYSALGNPKQDTLAIGFWNLENLYDTVDDPKINDEDFLPTSKYKWTEERYNEKLSHLSTVIHLMNSGKGPDIIGFAEVENKGVVQDLIKSNVKDIKYNIAHMDSPDIRGIDCAMIYKKDKFKLVKLEADSVHLPTNHPTRLILHATFNFNKEVLHVFVNHWPSRLGGQEESERNRVAAAQVLRARIDAVLKSNPKAGIFIMGDFNDEPDNVSITKELGAEHFVCGNADESFTLHNLAWERKSKGEGTLKYKNTWNLLDQIIVSSQLVSKKKSALKYICGSFEIFQRDFMLETDPKYLGSPLPTFGGTKYLAGYSDHFPVLAKFLFVK